tara:strand:+ start:495 stop:833 length:339 start_codon:yes stop_codon:yes gene_type:complete
MKFIQFSRNQANAADKLQLPTDGIISISAANITSCLILYTPIEQGVQDDGTLVPPNCLQYTLTVAATNGATLTRASICTAITDAVIEAGEGRNTLVPNMEVTGAAIGFTTFL